MKGIGLVAMCLTWALSINSLKAQLDISPDSIHSIFNGKYTEILTVDSIDKFVLDTIQNYTEFHRIEWFCSIRKINKRWHSTYQRHARLFISHVIEFDSYVMVFYSYASKSIPGKGFYLFNKTTKKYGMYSVRYGMKSPKETNELLKQLIGIEFYSILK